MLGIGVGVDVLVPPPPPAPEDKTLIASFCSDTGVALEFDVCCAAEVVPDCVRILLTPGPEADRLEERARVAGANDIVRAGDVTGLDEISEVTATAGVSTRVGSNRMDGTV